MRCHREIALIAIVEFGVQVGQLALRTGRPHAHRKHPIDVVRRSAGSHEDRLLRGERVLPGTGCLVAGWRTGATDQKSKGERNQQVLGFQLANPGLRCQRLLNGNDMPQNNPQLSQMMLAHA